jgi:hypothetical protein
MQQHGLAINLLLVGESFRKSRAHQVKISHFPFRLHLHHVDERSLSQPSHFDHLASLSSPWTEPHLVMEDLMRRLLCGEGADFTLECEGMYIFVHKNILRA